MQGEEFDELLDALPAHLRNRVLEAGGRQDLIKPVKKPNGFWYTLLASVTFVYAVPFVFLGLLLCIPIVTIPIGIAVMVFGCWPLSRLVHRYVVRLHLYVESEGGTTR